MQLWMAALPLWTQCVSAKLPDEATKPHARNSEMRDGACASSCNTSRRAMITTGTAVYILSASINVRANQFPRSVNRADPRC